MIIVLDIGKIIEQGTNEELLQKQGQYYRLWEMQQGNFKIEDDTEKEEEMEHPVDEDAEGVMSYT